MTSRTAILLTSVLVLGLTAAPVGASTSDGRITGVNTVESCSPGADVCFTDAVADIGGAFSGSTQLISADSPTARSTRSASALARYTIGFDLASAAREVQIAVTLHLDDAAASWVQDHPEAFGGTHNANSSARVLFQLFGHAAPEACGCGWFVQGAPSVAVVKAAAPGEAFSVSDTAVTLTMTATNPFGNNLLPAGHYETLLRGYALADLVGSGDWGTLDASMAGRIVDITVTSVSAPIATELALSVSGNGAQRTLTAVLTDVDSNPISGRTISFTGDGVALGKATTVDGVASIPLTGKYRGGTHLFTAEFAGDDTYEPSRAEASS